VIDVQRSLRRAAGEAGIPLPSLPLRVLLPPGADKLGLMPDLTRLLEAAKAGDRQAAAQLLPLVYDELRTLAAARMAAEAPGHTLDATALVHEAYLRLVGDQQFDGRGHFFAAAAEAMRRILVDHARAKRAEKRGDRAPRADLDPDQLPAGGFDPDRWIDLDEALTRFAAIDPSAAELAKLRVFGGLSVEEAGNTLGLPRATAFRTWTYARAWLTSRLAGGSGR
jgi:RNA polymerase sigma factor (TIGR02999 family)